MKTKQQIKNLREALIWWQTVPEANVYPGLGWWTKGDTDTTDCGTIACFGGWAARWPALREQGLHLSEGGMPRMKGQASGARCAQALFGDEVLWYLRGAHVADKHFKGSDHALVTNRIRWALKH